MHNNYLSTEDWIAKYGMGAYVLLRTAQIVDAHDALLILKDIASGAVTLEDAIDDIEDSIAEIELEFMEHGGDMISLMETVECLH